MSLSSPYQEHYYVADGVTTTFAFGSDFTALSSSYVKCIIYFDDGTNCVPTFNVDLTTGYISIVTLTKPDGTVLTVPPAGSIVRVFRDVPEQQNVTASQLQNYTAKQLEKIFDSVVAMIQEVSYSDLHKTIRLTETQRDVAVEQLTEAKDQAVLYWDFDSRTLKATDYGQDEIVKSETVDRLVYLQPEGKIYFIPKGSNNPIAIGSATIHNDLGGRNAPDCHPESAITNLTTHLQELRDRDTAIEYKADQALSKAGEALDTANHADANATYAVGLVNTFDGRLTQAESDASEAKEKAIDAKTTVDNHVLNYNNPHQVTKTQIGLGNCDNTSDLNKPISTATQNALDLKLPTSTKYGAALSLTINSTTYVVTAQLKDQDGNNLGTAQTIDLPLESVVVSGAYDSATKEVVLTLQGGSTIRFSVADLVSGLQTEITSLNMLSADLVDDTNTTHKFVTTTEKSTWSGKQDAISDLTTIRAGAAAGATAVQPSDLATYVTTNTTQTISGEKTFSGKLNYCAGMTYILAGNGGTKLGYWSYDIDGQQNITLQTMTASTRNINFKTNNGGKVTYNGSEIAKVSNIPTTTSALTNDSGFITSSDIPVTDVTVGGTSVVSSGVAVVPAIPTVNDATITITQGGVTKGSFTLNQASGDTIALDAGGGVGNIDNLTITTNTDSEIQAVATINANSAAGATNPVYDWVGTLSEYETLNIETLHPEWVCYITDDFTAQAYEAYSKSQTDTLLAGKVSTGHEVIDFQEPNAGNNYTWYRKYADGWVEQGGQFGGDGAGSITKTLPIEMADINYEVIVSANVSDGTFFGSAYKNSTTQITIWTTNYIGGMTRQEGSHWRVSGMAA